MHDEWIAPPRALASFSAANDSRGNRTRADRRGRAAIAKGIIVRRPWVVALLHATGLEGAAVHILQRLRRRYGDGPVLMRLPFREQAILLSPDHVRRVLEETPEPFQSDSSEKHVTLAHFQPEGSLISRGEDRAERRAFNEGVLESACPMHTLAGRFRQVVEDEVAVLLAEAGHARRLGWGAFSERSSLRASVRA